MFLGIGKNTSDDNNDECEEVDKERRATKKICSKRLFFVFLNKKTSFLSFYLLSCVGKEVDDRMTE